MNRILFDGGGGGGKKKKKKPPPPPAFIKILTQNLNFSHRNKNQTLFKFAFKGIFGDFQHAVFTFE